MIWRRPWILYLAALPLFLLLSLPIAALLLRLPVDQLVGQLQEPSAIQALLLSLQTTLTSVALIVVLGTPLALLLSRRNNKLLSGLIELPIVLPPAVAGVALLLLFGRNGPLGSLLHNGGIDISFSTTAVVIAQTFIASPFYIRAAAAAFSSVDRDVQQCALVDGATGFQNFWFVVMPITSSALIAGLMISWARALGEFGATIIFAGNMPGKTQTMPLAIYLGLERDLAQAIALSVILLIFSFFALLAAKFTVKAK